MQANSLNQMLQLQEEYDSFCHSIQLCVDAYKMLKQEKAVMEKQIHELETEMKMIAPCMYHALKENRFFPSVATDVNRMQRKHVCCAGICQFLSIHIYSKYLLFLSLLSYSTWW